MEDRQDPLLQGQVQVDQHIAATDQIQMGKGRIVGEVVPRKDTQVPDRLADLVMMIDAHEEMAEPFLRHVHLDVVRVNSRPGLLQGGVVDVGGQDLDGDGIGPAAQELQQANGQGVNFLAGGTAGHPDAKRVFRGAVLGELRKNPFAQGFEHLGVPEEVGDADQEILIQGIQLAGIFAQESQVIVDILEVVQGHAPQDAATDGAALVVGEIDRGSGSQQIHDPIQSLADLRDGGDGPFGFAGVGIGARRTRCRAISAGGKT